MRALALFSVAALLTLCGSAGALELQAQNPDFAITVPNLPSVRLDAQTASNAGISKAMAGTDGTYQVTLLVTKTEKPTTTRECAGVFLRSLLARPGMPDRDNVYRTPLDENTFLVLYILVEQGQQQLHADLLSSANTTHCVDMHVSRPRRGEEEVDDWRQTFAGSHVQDGRR